MLWLVVIAAAMWVLQLVLGLWQLKRFERSFKELRAMGRVAIGRAKGRFKAGTVVLLCINSEAVIIAGRKMQGMTIFAKPQAFTNFDGRVLTSLSEADCAGLDKSVCRAVLNAVENYKQYTGDAKATPTVATAGHE